MASEESLINSLRMVSPEVVRKWRSEDFARVQMADLTDWFVRRSALLLGTGEGHWQREIDTWEQALASCVTRPRRQVLRRVLDECVESSRLSSVQTLPTPPSFTSPDAWARRC